MSGIMRPRKHLKAVAGGHAAKDQAFDCRGASRWYRHSRTPLNFIKALSRRRLDSNPMEQRRQLIRAKVDDE